MKILIIGSSSFLGKTLATLLLSSLSAKVVGFQRKASTDLSSLETHPWSLGQPLPEVSLTEADWAVFCAHDFENPELTQMGYATLLQQFKATRTKCIFISSYSAFKDAPGDYGKSKYDIETKFLQQGHYVVRPGLIMGPGGMFINLVNNILKFPIVPIIGFNNAPIFSIGVTDLCQFLAKIITTAPEKKEFNVFYNHPYTQIELARAVKKSRGKPLLYLRLPLILFEIAVLVFEFFKIKPPITKENLKGYRRNTNEFRNTDIDFIGITKSPELYDFLT